MFLEFIIIYDLHRKGQKGVNINEGHIHSLNSINESIASIYYIEFSYQKGTKKIIFIKQLLVIIYTRLQQNLYNYKSITMMRGKSPQYEQNSIL